MRNSYYKSQLHRLTDRSGLPWEKEAVIGGEFMAGGHDGDGHQQDSDHAGPAPSEHRPGPAGQETDQLPCRETGAPEQCWPMKTVQATQVT